MATETIKIDGLKELEHALREIGPQIRGNPLRTAVRAMANIVEEDAIRRAPADEGTLKKSIMKKLIPVSERDRFTRSGDSFEGFDIGVRIGKGGAPYYYAVELGTDGAQSSDKPLSNAETGEFFGNEVKGQAAQPFLRPALEENRQMLTFTFTEKLGKTLEAAAKRLART